MIILPNNVLRGHMLVNLLNYDTPRVLDRTYYFTSLGSLLPKYGGVPIQFLTQIRRDLINNQSNYFKPSTVCLRRR